MRTNAKQVRTVTNVRYGQKPRRAGRQRAITIPGIGAVPIAQALAVALTAAIGFVGIQLIAYVTGILKGWW